MEKINIVWADDEIDLLKPHILFLENKGFKVFTATDGGEAIDLVAQHNPDIVFLDENMPGISGLEALGRIKAKYPSIPIIMITKSEEESIMEDAIGSKISDYLIKPVNPNQILLSIKKNLDTKRLVSEKTSSSYQQQFRELGMRLNDRLDSNEWMEIYREIVYWELELENAQDEGMKEILTMQKREANSQFCRFVEDNYINWLNNNTDDIPTMSQNVFKQRVAPLIKVGEPLFFVLIDNLRYDQWLVLKPMIEALYDIEKEEQFISILPTATQYARNALFAGLMPSEIAKLHPDLWLNDDDEGGKNMYEEQLLQAQLKRLGKNVKSSYTKITNNAAGKKLADSINNLMQNDFNAIVYNFVDMLSHARTEMEVIRELADDEPAYRSITLSWFKHSPLYDILKSIAAKKGRVVITTDHGTVHVKEPVKIVGDRNTNTNLRYKQGKNLSYSAKEVFEIVNPQDAFLPKINMSQRYVFARQDDFFAYPNNYNHYVNYYKNTFQHGGISMEEMIIPFVVLKAN